MKIQRKQNKLVFPTDAFHTISGLLFYFLLLVVGLSLSGCGETTESRASLKKGQNPVVSIAWQGDSARLLRKGKPYFILGAGGQSRLKRLKECGGNSIRIWDDNDADRILKQANDLGLTVFFGLWVERERDGFDYYDYLAVEKQYERIRKTVLKYRNHPAVLMWCVGNEWNLKARNISVYDEVNRIAKMIHSLDPNHPVTTAIGSNRPQTFQIIKERCPEIDVLSINVYGGIHELESVLEKVTWTAPYIISEFGALGHWESKRTDWQAPIEPTSDRKSEFVRTNYQRHIGSRPRHCLGSYVFIWGNKEEGTQTWYSFFDEGGRETAMVETMQELWTGRPPQNRAPVIRHLRVDNRDVTALTFSTREPRHRAQVAATDADGDSLTYRWEIRPQADQRLDYDYHDTPLMPVDGLIQTENQADIFFQLPSGPGEYRLFVYVYDTHNHVATANIPFLVKSDTVMD